MSALFDLYHHTGLGFDQGADVSGLFLLFIYEFANALYGNVAYSSNWLFAMYDFLQLFLTKELHCPIRFTILYM